MRSKKLNLKKIISYLLIFSVFFTSIQMGSMKKASAADSLGTNQVPGLVIREQGPNGPIRVIDKVTNDGTLRILENLTVGDNIYLTTESGYTIEGKPQLKEQEDGISIDPITVGDKNDYQITIKNFSDFVITVVMKDSTGKTQSYDVEMKFKPESSLKFYKIEVTLDNSKYFDMYYDKPDINGNYTLQDVDSSVKSAKIQLVNEDSTPIIFAANGGSSSTQATVDLAGGENIIYLTITHSDISRQYKLIINKKGQAKLQSLVPSTGALTPAFNSDMYDYTLVVPTTQTTVAFTPTAVDNSATIKINGVTVKSGKRSQDIKLDEGENKVTVELTTKDGDTNIYIVEVTRTEQFRSAQLSGLALTSGTLSPAFNKGIYEYTATVDNSVTSVGVTPTAEDPNATITVNGKTVPSGATSPYISLDEGGNSISVKVTDTKGNTNTYVVNILRRYSKDNVNLASLSVTDGTMSPRFDPDTYNYSVKVGKNIEKVRVLYTSQNDKAKIKINGKEYTNGQSDYIPLKVGANLAVVEVTSEDGTTTTTYKLSIIRGEIQGKDEWILVAGEWMFYGPDGIPVKNGWAKYDNQYYFLDINGHMKTGWLYESGKYYFLNDSGIMCTGWKYDKGYWYYFNGLGVMDIDNWETYNGKWYYFNKYGQMQTGWAFYKGRYYYLNDKGEMQKGWITWDNNQYYLNDDGTMKNGWLYNGRTWYYLDDSGMMVRGWQNINGKNYHFDAKGLMETGMKFIDGQWINLSNS